MRSMEATRAAQPRTRSRHESFTQGLHCEPLLALPLTLTVLALTTFMMAVLQGGSETETSRFWLAACTICIVMHCLFMAVYDSPRRLAERHRRGCPHIAPRQRS